MKIEHYCKNDPYTICKVDHWCEIYSLNPLYSHVYNPVCFQLILNFINYIAAKGWITKAYK